MTDARRAEARPTPAATLRSFWHSPPARRFRRNRAALLGLFIVLALVFVAIFTGVLTDIPPDRQNLRARLQPPSAEHPCGTDEFGRSILSRVIHGTRVSLFTGLVPVAIALAIGTVVGMIAGFY